MKYKLKMEIGDPSKDGHNQSKTIYFYSNKTVKEITEAYYQSCKLTGLVWKFNQNPIVNGEEINWKHPEYNDRLLFVEYEQYELSELAKNILESHDIDSSCKWDSDCVIDLFHDFIKLSLPDLEIEFVKEDAELLDITIGYGLFG